MKKTEFFTKIPDIIEHPSWGYGELEVIVDSKYKKGVCYRHKDNTASYGTYKSSWQELYDDLSVFLKERGHV